MNYTTTELIELELLRKKVDKRFRRIKALDKRIRRIKYEEKYDYLFDNHPKYIIFVNKILNKLGETTLLKGDHKLLDFTKEYVYSRIYL